MLMFLFAFTLSKRREYPPKATCSGFFLHNSCIKISYMLPSHKTTKQTEKATRQVVQALVIGRNGSKSKKISKKHALPYFDLLKLPSSGNIAL